MSIEKSYTGSFKMPKKEEDIVNSKILKQKEEETDMSGLKTPEKKEEEIMDISKQKKEKPDMGGPKMPEQLGLEGEDKNIESIIRNLSPIEILSLKIKEEKKEINIKVKTKKSSFEKEGMELKERLAEEFEGWKVSVRLGALIEEEDEDETTKDLEDFMLFGRKRKKGEKDPEIKNPARFA